MRPQIQIEHQSHHQADHQKPGLQSQHQSHNQSQHQSHHGSDHGPKLQPRNIAEKPPEATSPSHGVSKLDLSNLRDSELELSRSSPNIQNAPKNGHYNSVEDRLERPNSESIPQLPWSNRHITT